MKPKTLFYCTECGNETPKWAGKCPACGAWNTIVEQPQAARAAGKGASRPAGGGSVRRARPVTELEADAEIRFSTGMGELDRVLGGGAVKGSLVLVGGAPGIGKSTLMLQICESLCRENKVLYVSGEESEHQLKLRAKRLDVQSERLFVISETSLGDLLESVAAEAPDVLIVDSIQTLYNDALESPAGSVSQVKDCTMALMQLAKGQGITVFVIGHVNKEGSIAGPKVLEHMVDCVLYFEGDQHTAYRILRAAKKEQLESRFKYGALYRQNYYLVVKEKNRTYYELYTLPRTEEAPEGYNEVSFVCLRPDGAYESSSTVSSMCRTAKKKLEDMDDFHFHQLRHTYTSNLLSGGAAPKDVQELLGHADVSTTMNIYAHATKEAKRTSARLLDKVVGAV